MPSPLKCAARHAGGGLYSCTLISVVVQSLYPSSSSPVRKIYCYRSILHYLSALRAWLSAPSPSPGQGPLVLKVSGALR